MPFEPISPVGGFTATPELPRPQDDTRPEPTTGDAFGAAFRTENTIGSLLASRDMQDESGHDPYFDPWAEIADTPYEAYYEQFSRARSPVHFEAIKADIDRENTDRDVLARSGWTGVGASMAAGLLDWPTLVPGGALARTARGGISLLRSTTSVAAAGAVGAGAAEAVLQGTQQLRTAEESAMVIGGSAVLAGTLGAGLAKWVSRGELGALAPRVERDFQVPGAGDADPFEPGGLRPSVEAAAGASQRAIDVADAIRETAEEILPAGIRVQVVDTLGPIGDDGLFAIRAFHGTPHSFDRFDMGKIGTGEGAQTYGHGLYFAENKATAEFYRDALSPFMKDGEPIDGMMMGTFARAKIEGRLDEMAASLNERRQSITSRFGDEEMPHAWRMQLDDIDDELRQIEEVKKADISRSGQLYEVEIDAEPVQLLDLSAKIAKQDGIIDKVRALLKRLGLDRSDEQIEDMLRTQSGRFLYDELVFHFDDDPAKASQALKEAGIPGLRYLDSGSRTPTLNGREIEDPFVLDYATAKAEGRLGDVEAGLRAELARLRAEGEPTEAAAAKLFTSVERMRARRDEVIADIEGQLAKLETVKAGDVSLPDSTHNIVVFDDSVVKITKRNGEPVTAAERKAAVDQLFGVRQSETGPIAEGRFDPQQLIITIAADALDPAKTLRHESIHALKTMGLFRPKEWGTLEAAAKKQGWLETHNVRSLYEGVYKDRITDDLLLEEAIAEQFSLWRQGAKEFKGAIAAIFQRIQAFLERTGNALRGRGFQTADDVFAAVRSGEVASRAPGAVPAGLADAAAMPPAGHAASVGAAAVRRAEDTLKSAFGAEKAFRFQDPMIRLQTSKSAVSRRHVQELAETPLTYDKNALGEETAPGGSEMGAPGAVETRIKFWNGPLAEAVQAVDNAFLMYRKGRAKRFTGEVPALTLKDTIVGTDALTYPQFKQEISKALRRGDDSQIPEVAGAARLIRQKVLDPLKGEAIAAKLLPEDVSVETADSYLNRLYNKDRIIAERDQFKQVVSDWLAGQESTNRGVRARLAPMLERVDTVDAETSKLTAGIQKSEARLKDLEARAEEAARVQQFAFKRALERREPIEALQGRIADLGEQIEGPLDSLSSMRDLDSRIADAQQIARAMQEDDGGDLAAQIADVAELEENIDEIIAKAEAGIERVAEGGDLPLPRVEGRYAGAPLDGDEIEEIAGSWRFLREMKARRKPEGLTSFVVRMGGVEDPGGDVLSMIGRSKDRPGLIRKGLDDGGPQLALGGAGGSRPNTLDAMALRAWEDGFFPSKTERPTINEFLDALREDFTGNPMVRGDDEAYFVEAERAGQLADDLASRGIDPAAFRRESQLRLFLGQAPRDALAGEAGAGLKALRLVRKKLADIVDPYRKRITALTREARRRERNESLRQSERGVFATQARNRGRSLSDRVFAERGKLEKQHADLAAKEATAADLQKAIEEEVTKYQGKSANEAKSALERREEAELLREEKRQTAIARRDELQQLIAGEERALAAAPDEQRLLSLQSARDELAELEKAAADPKRLRAADKPVLAAARKIAAQVDKEPGEIGDLADQIIDRILGTPDGRLPYDAHLNSSTSHGASVEARGPLAARQFMIPDLAIERWLEGDIETLLRAYTRTMSADVEMTKRFGTADMKLQIKEIAEDYAKRSAAASTPAERQRLHKQRDADIRDLAAIRDRLRGTYNVPSDPNAILVRAGRVVSSLNYMRMLGGMSLSAIPDVGGIVFSHGMLRVFGDGLVPLLRNWGGARIAMNEVKLAGTALDMVLDSRAMQIADVMDDFGRHTKFERAVSSMSRNFGVVSLMAPWNAAMKQFTGIVTMTRMLRTMERLASGKAKPKEIERLAASGISQANARKIAEQFAKHGKKGGGVWFANTAEWDAGSRPAIEAFRAALVRDVDRIIITPGQDRPLWMSTEIGRLVGQFKSFSIAAMQRVLIAGLQQRDLATLSGAALMTALGGLSAILKAKAAGVPLQTDWSDPKKNSQFLVEAIDRSGLTGWLMEVNSMTEKLTRGAVGLSAITGKPVSRYAQRNIASSLFGPTAGTIQEFARVAGAAGSGEWNQSDSRAMRRLIPYNNIFYLRQLFDQAEAGINDFLGVPKPAGARR